MVLDEALGKINKDDIEVQTPIEDEVSAQNTDIAQGVTEPAPQVKKNSAPVKKLYERIEGIGINMDELRDILDCTENQLILSGAGSGKTTGLVLKLIKGLVSGEYMKTAEIRDVEGVKRIQVPKKIFVGTFLKTGAEELEKAFGEMCSKLKIRGLSAKDITFSTLHAEFYSALKDMGVNINIETNNQKNMRSVLQKYNIKNRMSYSKQLTIDEVRDCECILSYARNRLDDKRFQHPLMDDYGIESFILPRILDDMKQLRRAGGKMDFEDLQELLYEYAQKNPNIVEFLKNRYDIILLDEFQDTSQIQYEVLKYYIAGCETVIAIGDDDQTIYSWRGSDIDIISKRFEEDVKPVVHTLTTNYRCAENILNPVIKSIEQNKNRHPKVLKAHNKGGELHINFSKDINDLIADVKADIAKGYKVGILSRTNFDLLMPAMLLELDESIDFVMNKTISMGTRVCQNIFGVIDLVTKRYTPEFENLLGLFLSLYNKREAKCLADIIKMNKGQNIFTIDIDDIKYSTPNLYPVVQGLRDVEKRLGKVDAYIYLLDVLATEVYTGTTPYAQKARDLCAFTKTFIQTSDLCKDMDIGDISELFSLVLPERLRKRVMSNRTTADVKITTIHEAKGKEWDSVYIWNDVNGVFPASVGKRNLTEEEFEEERRVHYIAWTRAKKKLCVYTQATNQSPFLLECDTNSCIVDSEDGQSIAGEVEEKTQVIAKFNDNRTLSMDSVTTGVSAVITNLLNGTDIKPKQIEYREKVNEILYHMSVDTLIERISTEVYEDIQTNIVTNRSVGMRINYGTYSAINRIYKIYSVDDPDDIDDDI